MRPGRPVIKPSWKAWTASESSSADEVSGGKLQTSGPQTFLDSHPRIRVDRVHQTSAPTRRLIAVEWQGQLPPLED